MRQLYLQWRNLKKKKIYIVIIRSEGQGAHREN